MRIITFFIGLFFISTVSGQIELKDSKIGIGTTTPDKDVHFASDELLMTDKLGVDVRMYIGNDGRNDNGGNDYEALLPGQAAVVQS